MTNIADTVSDLDKVKAEGFTAKEDVHSWAMSHGYGLALAEKLVEEWSGDAPEGEEVVDEVVDEVVEEVVDEVVEEEPKSSFWKNN